MFIDFTGEKLPKILPHVMQIMRHKVLGGWYVRIVLTNQGYSAGGQTECAAFVPDPGHCWKLDAFNWEAIKREPIGGIYRARAGSGWIILATAQGKSRDEDGDCYYPRLGSLVFIQDMEFQWECAVVTT